MLQEFVGAKKDMEWVSTEDEEDTLMPSVPMEAMEVMITAAATLAPLSTTAPVAMASVFMEAMTTVVAVICVSPEIWVPPTHIPRDICSPTKT